MKRHAGLQALSRDHHHGLVLARRIHAAATLDAALVAEVVERFARELEPHFRIEEEDLLPALLSAGEEALVARTLDEHRQLRAFVAAVTAGGPVDDLRAFADLLDAHIRFEERTLFETAQSLALDLDRLLRNPLPSP